jgi:hypothetical protein
MVNTPVYGDDGIPLKDEKGNILTKPVVFSNPEEAREIRKKFAGALKVEQYIARAQELREEFTIAKMAGNKIGVSEIGQKLKTLGQDIYLLAKDFHGLGALQEQDLKLMKNWVPDPDTGLDKIFNAGTNAIRKGFKDGINTDLKVFNAIDPREETTMKFGEGAVNRMYTPTMLKIFDAKDNMIKAALKRRQAKNKQEVQNSVSVGKRG